MPLVYIKLVLCSCVCVDVAEMLNTIQGYALCPLSLPLSLL